MSNYLAVVFACIAVFMILYYANERSVYISQLADCVATEARAQGYAGNPYSREAWDTFAEVCK